MTAKTLHLLLSLCLASTFGEKAAAQDSAELLVDAPQQVDSGMALARRQAAETDLPGALGTLERLLFAHPQAVPARLLYASLLCRLDDRQGAELEIGLLAGKPIADADWAEVGSACGSMERPAPPKRKR